jgi:epsilon-lactone hydrolase
MKFSNSCRVACAGLALCLSGAAQSAPTPSADSASFDADGTAHVTRVVPILSTISPDAQEWLASLAKKKSQSQTLAERRVATGA